MISSKSNPKIKQIIHLQKSSERKEQNLVIIEGFREINRALLSGWEMDQIFVCEELAGKKQEDIFGHLNAECQIEYVTKEVFERIAYREGSDGLIALSTPKYIGLEQLKLGLYPLIIILEGIEKPGNIGAVLRTADAAQVDAVIVCDTQTDLYNPNTIRSSLGCIFSNQVVATSSENALKWLNDNNINCFCTSLEASKDYLQSDFTGATAIVMGTESTGLSSIWTKNSYQNIKIDMLGIADSLNVSVTTAVVVFEAKRQRKSIE